MKVGSGELYTGLKLLDGSHELPSGGSCLVEAAIFAAGFEYQAVGCGADAPSCFCPTLSDMCITINDILPEGPRQKLMKYLPMLPGSYHGVGLQRRREKLAVIMTTREILYRVLLSLGERKQARFVRVATSPQYLVRKMEELDHQLLFKYYLRDMLQLQEAFERYLVMGPHPAESTANWFLVHYRQMSMDSPSRKKGRRYLPTSFFFTLLDAVFALGKVGNVPPEVLNPRLIELERMREVA